MNRERLIVLRDFLTTVPEHRFEMARWFENPESNDRLDACGFAGCAAGWATTIPAFQNAGLTRRGQYIGLKDHPDLNVWETLRWFFDLTTAQGDYLFDPCTYDARGIDGRITTGMVIDRINRLLLTDGKAVIFYTENDL